jgi:hypothetical protein
VKIIAPKANGTFELPAEGIHVATFSKYEDLGFRPDPFNPGESKHEVKLTFELPNGVKQFAWMRASLHAKATLHEVVTALLGANPPDEVELENLYGKQCEVEIEHYVTPKGQKRSKIVGYRRLRAK